MTVTVTPWPGTSGAAANSYASVSDADAYFATRLGASGWTSLTGSAGTDTKGQALITATRMIDRQRWAGVPATGNNVNSSLAWPRSGVTDKYGDAVTSTGLPTDLVIGCEELALSLLEDESVQDTVAGGSNTKRVKAGQVEVEFFRPTLGVLGRFPQVVQELLSQFLAGAGSVAGGVVSGDDRKSYFDIIVDDDPDVAVDNTFGVIDVFP